MADKKHSLVSLAFCAAVLAVGLGCSQNHDVERLQAFLSQPRTPVVGMEYRVLPPDVLSFASPYVPEIDGLQQRIRPDGKINLPLLGEIFVAGCTAEEIAHKVAWAARRYYKRIRVTVFIDQYNSQKIYVWGEVAAKGAVPWTGADTLLDILARAQPTRLAWPERIRVIRAKQPTKGGYIPVPKDERKTTATTNEFGAEELTINLIAMIKSGDMSHNILLRPDDVIYVPPNPFAKVGLALETILFPIRPIVETIRAPADIDEARNDVRDIRKD